MQEFSDNIIKHLMAIMSRLDKMDRKMDLLVVPNKDIQKDDFLDNQDLCILLGVTKKTLYRYRKKGLLKSYTFDNRKMYYKKSEIPDSLKVKSRK